MTEPIYTRAKGRWARYQHHLEPVIARLAPRAERFGYGIEDGHIPAWPAPGRSEHDAADA